LFVQDAAQIAEIDKFDFAFVPHRVCRRAPRASGPTLIVNTRLVRRDAPSRMSDAYMQLIKPRTPETSYFYSVNRFARYEEWMSPQDVRRHVSQAVARLGRSPVLGTPSAEAQFPPGSTRCIRRSSSSWWRKLAPEERLFQVAREPSPGCCPCWPIRCRAAARTGTTACGKPSECSPSKPLIQKYIDGAIPDVFRDARLLSRARPPRRAPAAPRLPEGLDLTARPAPAVSKSIRQKIAELIR